MTSQEQHERDVLLADMREKDRVRAAAQLQREGTAAGLSDYARALLGLPSHDEEERVASKRQEAYLERRAHVADAVRPKKFVWPSGILQRCCEHVIDLCVAHDIAVRSQTDGGGKCSTDNTTIWIPPISNFETYAIALHELGHAIDPDADSRRHRYIIDKNAMISARGEMAAWRYAMRTAVTWERTMQDRMLHSLKHYSVYGDSEERQSMGTLLRDGALKIKEGRPWTFGQLDTHCKHLAGDLTETPALRTAALATDQQKHHDEALARALDRIDALETQVKELTNRPSLQDRGVFKDGGAYQPGHGVTSGGSFWICQRATSTEKPGTGTAWRLAVKRGQDGRDRKDLR